MEKVDHYKDCAGCYACVGICPANCITMEEDNEGFRYPRVDKNKCKNCGLCVKRCPQNHKIGLELPKRTVAIVSKDKNLSLNSSSGGAFSTFAIQVIKEGGVVFGTMLDSKDWEAKVISVDCIEDLSKLRGSKYVQSNMSSVYPELLKMLQTKPIVLFAGTPCQVAGVKERFGKEYQNLVTIDLLCHGVPSPKVFKDYMAFLNQKSKDGNVISYDFRDKKKFGWKLASAITYEKKKRIILADCDYYMNAYKKAVNYRECCYHCNYATSERVGDITIGDYWGVEKFHKEIQSTAGVSLLLLNSEKGIQLYDKIDSTACLSVESKLEYAVANNGTLNNPTPRSEVRNHFYDDVTTLGFETGVKKNVRIKSKSYNFILVHMPKSIREFLNALKTFYKVNFKY